MEKVAVIIVTYNGINWIEKCLRSVVNSSIKPTIIVIDNKSVDGTIDVIKNKFEDIILLEQNNNLGFGAANNIGISYALNKGANFVFLLNQDAYLEKDTIERLIQTSLNNNEYGILSPIHLNGRGDKLDKNFSNYVNYNNNSEFYSDFILKKKLKTVYPVPFVNAAGWLVPKITFDIIGGFDPIFFHYGEDDNFCQRLAYHGLKIGVVPTTFLLHDREFRLRSISNTDFEKLRSKERLFKNQWANIQVDTSVEIKKTQKKVRRLIVKMLFKLQLKKAKFYFVELKLIKRLLPIISKSRSRNKKKGNHYL